MNSLPPEPSEGLERHGDNLCLLLEIDTPTTRLIFVP